MNTPNVMTYNGYAARVEFDAEDGLFVGHLDGINDVIGFHSDTVSALVQAFRNAVDDYTATCERAGKAPEKPYSGNLMIRVKPEVHARAALAAQLNGKSLNQWSEEALMAAAQAAVEP
jgi:predicted HicB family RNase H-like nuclease